MKSKNEDQLYYDYFISDKPSKILDGKPVKLIDQRSMQEAIDKALNLYYSAKMDNVYVIEYKIKKQNIEIIRTFDAATCEKLRVLL